MYDGVRCHVSRGAGASTETPRARALPLPRTQEVKEKRDADLLVLPTDAAVFEDAKFG